jgi:hypothetical protein
MGFARTECAPQREIPSTEPTVSPLGMAIKWGGPLGSANQAR